MPRFGGWDRDASASALPNTRHIGRSPGVIVWPAAGQLAGTTRCYPWLAGPLAPALTGAPVAQRAARRGLVVSASGKGVPRPPPPLAPPALARGARAACPAAPATLCSLPTLGRTPGSAGLAPVAAPRASAPAALPSAPAQAAASASPGSLAASCRPSFGSTLRPRPTRSCALWRSSRATSCARSPARPWRCAPLLRAARSLRARQP
jgi:hypothetical protein